MSSFVLGYFKAHLQASFPYIQIDFVHSPRVEYLLLYGRILPLHDMFPNVTISIACKFATSSNNHQDQGPGGGIGGCSLVKKSFKVNTLQKNLSVGESDHPTKASYGGLFRQLQLTR